MLARSFEVWYLGNNKEKSALDHESVWVEQSGKTHTPASLPQPPEAYVLVEGLEETWSAWMESPSPHTSV